MRRLLDTVMEAPPPSVNGTTEHSLVAEEWKSVDTAGSGGEDAYFNSSLLVILAAMLSTLVCVIAFNSIVRCSIRCNRRRFDDPGTPPVASSTGLSKQALRQIPLLIYGIGQGATFTATDCPICLTEFAEGDKVRVLPECHHGFHLRCIDAWLALQSSCPTCRHSVVLDRGGSSEAGDTWFTTGQQ